MYAEPGCAKQAERIQVPRFPERHSDVLTGFGGAKTLASLGGKVGFSHGADANCTVGQRIFEFWRTLGAQRRMDESPFTPLFVQGLSFCSLESSSLLK